jgi:hypothetical protein
MRKLRIFGLNDEIKGTIFKCGGYLLRRRGNALSCAVV